jgi:hypothetical protein
LECFYEELWNQYFRHKDFAFLIKGIIVSTSQTNQSESLVG